MMNKILLYFSIKYYGNWEKIYDALLKKENVDLKLVEETEKKLKCGYLTMLDDGYPAGFRSLKNPPFVIFYYGNLKILTALQTKICILCDQEVKGGEESQISKICQTFLKNNMSLVCYFENGIIEMLIEQCHKYEINNIIVLKTPILNALDNHKWLESLGEQAIIISELYFTETVVESDKMLKFLPMLTKNFLIFKANYGIEIEQIIAYLKGNKNNIFVMHVSSKKYSYFIKQGIIPIKKIDDIVTSW